METMFSSGMCRCCASEGTFKDLSSKYRWMGVDEVYSDMLRECFDLTLSMTEDCMEGGICEVCITQLRNAANFKKQVLTTEEQFKRMLQNKPFKSNIVKVEVNPPDDELRMTDEDNNMSADNFSDPEYEVPIKMESSDEGKSRKRPMRTSSRKKIKGEGESSGKRVGSDVGITLSKVKKIAKPTAEKRKAQDIIKKKSKVAEEFKKPKVPRKSDVEIERQIELGKHIHNLQEILLNTNATPLRTHAGLYGYACCFCQEATYSDLEELKTHTLMNHGESEKMRFMKNHNLSDYVVKLDVSSLQCIICLKKIVKLEDLMQHLTSEHGRSFYTDINNQILPIRFEEGRFTCVVCDRKMEHFKSMLAHLNMHYGSHRCKICDSAYMTRRNMLLHEKQHKQGDFPCATCSKVFDTSRKLSLHEKSVHSGENKHRCPICMEKFYTYRKRQRHMVKEHQMEVTLYNCESCDKTFIDKTTLSVHRRRDHLLERRFECQECDKKFYSLELLNNHKLTHTGEKQFQCDVCLKFYGRKCTLREHMRIHQDDRRFKCDLCDQAFVQKCSWKGHMKSKHSIVV